MQQENTVLRASLMKTSGFLSVPRKRLLAAALTLSLCGPVTAQSVEEVGVLAGSGRHAHMAALVVTSAAPWSWWESAEGRLHTYWQADFSQWKGKGAGSQTIHGIGLAPVFRYSWSTSQSWQPYVEGAIGLHYFSGVRLSTRKRMGTRFEFGDHVGFGLRLGRDTGLDLGYRYQHYSNAGISRHNGGVNFHQVQLRSRF
jgi:hypothetical protein